MEHADRPLRIGSFSAASNVTGIVSRHRRYRQLLHEHGALSLLGLRRGGAVRRHRDDPGRDGHPLAYKDAVFLSPHKFIGGPRPRGCWWPGASCSPTGCPTCPAAGPCLRHADDHRYLDGPGAPRGGRHPGDHRGDPGRPGVPAQGGRRDATRSARTRSGFLRRAVGRLAAASRRSSCSATSTPSGSRSSRSWCARRRGASCTTTSWWRCSTTSSASSRAAAARAPGPTVTGCSASTSTARTSSSARSRAAARGSSRAGCG